MITAGGVPSIMGMVTGAGIGATVNTGAQYVFNNGKINLIDTVMGGVASGLTFGPATLPSLLINAGGAFTASVYKGENPNVSLAGAAIGSLTGSLVVGKIEGALNTKFNPWYQQQWIDLGLGISKQTAPNVLPSFHGTSGGAVSSEGANGFTGIWLNPPPPTKKK